MTTTRKGLINFGDSYPNHPTDTQLWVRTDQNSILRYDGTNWVAIGNASGEEVPLVVSASPTINNGASGNQTVIQGAFFSNGADVKFVGTNNIEYGATAVTRVNSGRLIATQPNLLVAHEPYDIKVVNSDGSYSILDNALDVGSGPAWTTTSGTLGTFTTTQPMSASVLAVDLEGQTVSYSSNNFSIPGLTLGSNGVISGTSASIATASEIFNFDINASDGINATPRSFSITLQSNPLAGYNGLKYSFNADDFILGNTVSSWPAQSGIGSLSNISATNSTTNTVVSFNTGYKALRTSGTGFPGWKISDSAFSSSWVTAAIVFTTNVVPSQITDALRIIQGRFGNTLKYQQIIRAGGGGGGFVLDNGAAGNALVPSRVLSTNKNYVIVTKYNPTTGASQTLFDDNYIAQTYTATLTGNDSQYYSSGGGNVWGFGQGSNFGSTSRNIDIASCALWDSELTLDEMKAVMAYYKNKYGI
jgi:hypothetical protein